MVYVNAGKWACLVSSEAPEELCPCRRRNRRCQNIRSEPEIPRYKADHRLVLESLLSVWRLRLGVLTCALHLFLCMCVSPKFVTGGCWVDFRSTCTSGYDPGFAIFFLLQFPFYDFRLRINICSKFGFWKLLYLETGLVDSQNIDFSDVAVFVFWWMREWRKILRPGFVNLFPSAYHLVWSEASRTL